MTHEEFNNWLHSFAHAFPQTRQWLKELPDMQATLKVWRGVFGDVSADEVALVTMKLAAGDLPPVKAFEREQTAATIRRHVLDLRHKHERRNDGLSEAELVRPKSSGGFECGTALAGILKDLAGGADKAETLAKWLPETPSEQQPRYRCLPCKDTGLRKVWAVRSMKDAELDRLTRRGTYTCVTRCTCSKGGEQRFSNLAEYNERVWCEHGNGDWEAEAANLKEFMAGYGSHRVERMPNYQESFANY